MSYKQLAIVVGATGTFGTEIVRQLIAQELHVLAVGRNADALATPVSYTHLTLPTIYSV